MSLFDEDENVESENAVPKRKMMTKGSSTISTVNLNFQIPSNKDAEELVRETHNENDWRYLLLHFLNKNAVQYSLMTLLLLDLIILFVEIFLVGHYPPCNIIERDCISCCPSLQDDHTRFWQETTIKVFAIKS